MSHAQRPSSATATGGGLSNGMMMVKFHIPVKTERAVAVGCSAFVRPHRSFSRSRQLSSVNNNDYLLAFAYRKTSCAGGQIKLM